MRQIVLDTETTGLETSQDHRIIEIGCVELIDRRITDNSWHHYINPDREIDAGAFEVHGISNESLQDKPRFGDIAQDFINYIDGAELVIHNAPFDVGFLNNELQRSNAILGSVEEHCSVLDTLSLARRLFPGQRATLDALCKRYGVDNSKRELHGALLDAELLAEVYIELIGGRQAALVLGEEPEAPTLAVVSHAAKLGERSAPRRFNLGAEALAAHRAFVETLGDKAIWTDYPTNETE